MLFNLKSYYAGPTVEKKNNCDSTSWGRSYEQNGILGNNNQLIPITGIC